MRAIPFGHVVFRTGTRRVQLLITPGVAKIVDGYAKYSEVALERGASLVEFDGRGPRKMEIPVLFDGYRDKFSQETAIASLETMLIPPNVRGGVPPRVIAEGTLPILGLEWAMTLTWGDDVVYDPRTGQRLRQDAVVVLTEQSAQRLLAPTVLPATGIVWVKYTTQKGDTLARLAARFSNTPQGREWYRRVVMRRNGLSPASVNRLPKTISVPK